MFECCQGDLLRHINRNGIMSEAQIVKNVLEPTLLALDYLHLQVSGYLRTISLGRYLLIQLVDVVIRREMIPFTGHSLQRFETREFAPGWQHRQACRLWNSHRCMS
jgi:hypothetical protein